MIEVRKSGDRGGIDHGWLRTFHTFSFGDYFDPQFMGFRSLRVINEDYVQPSQGFGTHGHKDMEIITYVMKGQLEHKDSMGNGSTIVPGEVQYMSAGKGVRHSEFNPSDKEWVHLFQIWIMPDEKNYEPRYGQKKFSDEEKVGKWCLLVSPEGSNGSLAVRQDAWVYSTKLANKAQLEFSLKPGRFAWVQMAQGSVNLNGKILAPGDGAAVANESLLKFTSEHNDTEFLLFDLN